MSEAEKASCRLSASSSWVTDSEMGDDSDESGEAGESEMGDGHEGSD